MPVDDLASPVLPKPGDVLVCSQCGAWLVFNEDHQPRLFGADDFLLYDDEMLKHLRRLTRIIITIRKELKI